MVIVGAFLSIMLPLIGPPTVKFPATSNTVCVPVNALFVSVPAGTLVKSRKLASAGFARPDSASLAVQAMLTSVACQRPSAEPHNTTGSVLSMRTVLVFVVSTLPQLSRAKNETTVMPSLLSVNDAVAPFTVVVEMVCAPAALYVMRRTPATPESVAFSVTRTLVLFQPLTLASGVSVAVVVGGVTSCASYVRPTRVDQRFMVVWTCSPKIQTPVPSGSPAPPR